MRQENEGIFPQGGDTLGEGFPARIGQNEPRVQRRPPQDAGARQAPGKGVEIAFDVALQVTDVVDGFRLLDFSVENDLAPERLVIAIGDAVHFLDVVHERAAFLKSDVEAGNLTIPRHQPIEDRTLAKAEFRHVRGDRPRVLADGGKGEDGVKRAMSIGAPTEIIGEHAHRAVPLHRVEAAPGAKGIGKGRYEHRSLCAHRRA